MTAPKLKAVVTISRLTRSVRVVSAFLFITIYILLMSLSARAVFYPALTDRSIQIGSALASDVTNHSFNFNTSTSGAIGSIVIEYCSNLPFVDAPCTAPTGLVVNAATLATATGISGLSISAPDSSINRLVLTRIASVITPTPVALNFTNVTNHSDANSTVYVRIGTYVSTDGTGPPTDFGAVLYATTKGVGVGGYVPPYLTFCVGVTVDLNCANTQGSLLSFGELSSTNPNVLTSQFSAATNDLAGYNTFVSGGTMTAGNSIIPPLTTNAASQVGTSQFGINLRANSSPSAGANVSGSGIAVASTTYNVSNSFRYTDGERVASASGPTEFNRFTVTYLVNVSTEQRPGVYASSYTYTAIANF